MSKDSIINVRIDADLKNSAAEVIHGYGLTIADVVRLALKYVVENRKLPSELIMNEKEYDEWFTKKVSEAMECRGATRSFDDYAKEVRARYSDK